MPFDARAAETRIALDLIGSTDMPRLAWDALEAGLDGPAIRRLAALEFPTVFQIRELLPRVMEELHLVPMRRGQAALQLAKMRAQEILRSELDPLQHLRDFEYLWIQADYCSELSAYGNLDDEVHVARCMGQSEQEIRAWVLKRIQELAVDY
jgi:hypothetical protein